MTPERTPSTEAGRALLLAEFPAATLDGTGTMPGFRWKERDALLDAILAIEAEARAPLVAALEDLFQAADAFLDELDAPPGDPLSDHYAAQAEARLRAAVEAERAALRRGPVVSDDDLWRALDAWEKNGAPNRQSLAAFGLRAALAARSEPRATNRPASDPGPGGDLDMQLDDPFTEPRVEGLREAQARKWRHAGTCAFERDETGEETCTCGLHVFRIDAATPTRLEFACGCWVKDVPTPVEFGECDCRSEPRAEGLREALEWAMAPNPRYEGRHRIEPRCRVFMPMDGRCNCGYEEAAAVLVATPPAEVERVARSLAATPPAPPGSSSVPDADPALDVDDVMGWLRRADGRIGDIFGLWTQGKRDDRWVAERLVAEGHIAALAPEQPE